MRCPVCRAADNRTDQCRRCKADLTLLQRLEHQHDRHLALAAYFARSGAAHDCIMQAHQANEIRADGESARHVAMGFLLARDFAAAWQWFQHCRSLSRPQP